MQERKTEVIFENSDIIAVYKEKGLPTVPLKRNPEGDSLLNRIAAGYPEVRNVHGMNEWEGGVIHRLDTPTSGIVICALSDETYKNLIEAQKKGDIVKHYIASTTERENGLPGFEPFPYTFTGDALEITSYFRPYGEKGASVRPVLTKSRHISGGSYTTKVMRTSDRDTFECVITKGFRHQIRSHLSWSGHPITGDGRYGGTENDELLLEAVSVAFPYRGKIITVKI